jgi:pimeloyl-ACP methyl ester carboxylesterase
MCDARLWRDVPLPKDRISFFPAICDHDTIEALARAILKHYHGPLILIGFSMGAIVALMMAGLAPERIVGLVLCSTNCTADLPERAIARVAQQASVRHGHLDVIVREELKPYYLSHATQGEKRKSILDLTFDMGMSLGPIAFVRQSEALRTRPSLCEILDKRAIPILIMVGSDDTLCPPSWHKAMAASAERATYIEFADAGHLVPLEVPDAFGRAIMTWLNQNFPLAPEIIGSHHG